MTTKAQRLSEVYAAATGQTAVALADRPDKGRAWFAVANAADDILANVKHGEPFDYELAVPVEQRRIKDLYPGHERGDELLREELPTTLRVRPIVADDLCRPEFGKGDDQFNNAVLAHVLGVDLDMLEWRLDPGDVTAAEYLIHEAGGPDASWLLREVFVRAGGEPLDDDNQAWIAVAVELFSEDCDTYYLVRCRTPGLGTVKVGPLTVGHWRLHEDVAQTQTEWDGRLEALAKATGREREQLARARVEDASMLWLCFQLLKKKAKARGISLFESLLSSRSTGGPGETSTRSDSPTSQ